MIGVEIAEDGVGVHHIDLRVFGQRAAGEDVVDRLRIAFEHRSVAFCFGEQEGEVLQHRLPAFADPGAVKLKLSGKHPQRFFELEFVEVPGDRDQRIGIAGQQPVNKAVDRRCLRGAHQLGGIKRRLYGAEAGVRADLRSEVVADHRHGLAVEGKVGPERRARSLECGDELAIIGVGDGEGGSLVKIDPVAAIQEGDADIAARLAASLTIFNEWVVEHRIAHTGLIEDRICQGLQGQEGRSRAIIDRAAIVLDLLQHNDVRGRQAEADVEGDAGELAAADVVIAIIGADIEVEHVVGRNRQLVDRAGRQRGGFRDIGAGLGHCDCGGRADLEIAESVVDHPGDIVEHRAGGDIGDRENLAIERAGFIDLDALGVEVRTCTSVEGTQGIWPAAHGDQPACCNIAGRQIACAIAGHGVQFAKPAGGIHRHRVLNGHQHPF